MANVAEITGLRYIRSTTASHLRRPMIAATRPQLHIFILLKTSNIVASGFDSLFPMWLLYPVARSSS